MVGNDGGCYLLVVVVMTEMVDEIMVVDNGDGDCG